MKVKGVDCICLSLNFLNAAVGSTNDKTCIQQMESAIGNHVQLTPYKTRQRFLSPESDEDHFKVTCLLITIKPVHASYELVTESEVKQYSFQCSKTDWICFHCERLRTTIPPRCLIFNTNFCR